MPCASCLLVKCEIRRNGFIALLDFDEKPRLSVANYEEIDFTL